MPYTRVGGLKISDHHVRSPLLNINRACQSCHRWDTAELKARAEQIQERTYYLRNMAIDAVVALIADINAAAARGVSEDRLNAARDYQRKAQFFADFIEAENSMGFHAPGEAARVLADAIDFARRGQLVLRDGTPTVTRTTVAGSM